MRFIIFATFFLLFLNACSRDKKSGNKKIEEHSSLNDQIVTPKSETIVKMDSIIMEGRWEVEMILKNGKILSEDPLIESTLTFEDDQSFGWELESDKVSGNWTLDNERMLIHILSKDEAITSEWNIKHRKNVMVWIGTAKYGQNTTQMKLNQRF